MTPAPRLWGFSPLLLLWGYSHLNLCQCEEISLAHRPHHEVSVTEVSGEEVHGSVSAPAAVNDEASRRLYEPPLQQQRPHGIHHQHQQLALPQVKEAKAAVHGGRSRKKAGGRSSLRRSRQPLGGFVPTYIPKIGIANVTTATALPPPPPTLNPAKDYQPFDTAMGDWFMKQFVSGPTVTPPPSQAAINLAYGCPLLLLPDRIFVEVPTGCPKEDGSAGRAQKWTDVNYNEQISWQESCVSGGIADVKYSMPFGDTYSYTRTETSLWGSRVDLIDCGLNKLYTFEEKVFKKTGKVNALACDKFGSCDGTVYLQYFIYDNTGALLGVTPMLTLFQNAFSISDTSGNKIADIFRNGQWTPKDGCTDYRKDWVIQFASSPAALIIPPKRWVVASMMTIIGMRDEERDAAGMVKSTMCQQATWYAFAISILTFIGLPFFVLFCFYNQLQWLISKFTTFLFRVEDSLFPRTMQKPSKYTP